MYSTRFFHRTLTASALALFVFAGCQSARMPLPGDLSSQTPLLAERGDEPGDPALRLGAYEAHSFWQIQAESPSALGAGEAALVSSAGAKRYGFTLRLGDTDLWDASCSTDTYQDGHANDDLIACTLTAHGQQQDTWTLVLSPMGDKRLAGTLQQGEMAYEVRGTDCDDAGATTYRQTGYLLGRSGSVIAAVDVTEAGRLWMRPSSNLRESTLLTAASAALILTEDLRA